MNTFVSQRLLAVVLLLAAAQPVLAQPKLTEPLTPDKVQNFSRGFDEAARNSPEYQQTVAQQKELLELLLLYGTLDLEARLSSETAPTDQSFSIAEDETQAPARRRPRLNNVSPFLARLGQSKTVPLIKVQTSTKWVRAGVMDYSPCKYTLVLWLEPPRKLYLLQEVATRNLVGVRGPWKIMLTRHVTVPVDLLGSFYDGLAKFGTWTAQALALDNRNARTTVLQTNGVEITFTASLRALQPTFLCGLRDPDAPFNTFSLELDEQRTEDLLQQLEALPAAFDAELRTQAQAAKGAVAPNNTR